MMKKKMSLRILPPDSPFLASDVTELQNMKQKYSGARLLSIFNPNNPKFFGNLLQYLVLLQL